jgi:uncharacterized membrane protein HdeD (DUF308 family)
MLTPAQRDVAETVSRYWWLNLITGILFLILGFIVLSYDADSLLTVSILIGVSFVFTGVAWLFMAGHVPDMKWWYIVGGILAIIAGIITFAYPDETLVVLGLLLGWFLLIAGVIDVVVSLTNRDRDLWWLGLIQGIIMFVLGVWAAGEDNRSVFLLLTLTGIFCVIRGIGEIVAAFGLRGLKKELRAHPST